MKRKNTEESKSNWKSLTAQQLEQIEWEVEYIIGHSVEPGGCFYNIKWLGYSWDECTWEKEENLSCPDVISFYKQMVSSAAAKLPFAMLSESQVNHLKVASAKKSRSQKAQLKAFEARINLAGKNLEARIWVENTVDGALPDENFMYITKCKAGNGVVIHSDPLTGCECTSCGASSVCCHTHGNTLWAYDKSGHLRLAPGVVIYECNMRCKCAPAPDGTRPFRCRNRIVQRGRRIPVTIFRTANGRGWGVRTNSYIAKGRFVTEYVGEVITIEEANATHASSEYLMDLDFTDDRKAKYTIDAEMYGNMSHFINHSCDPNLVVHGVIINNPDISMPQIALFAKREIQAGEELTFDYNASLPTGSFAQSPMASPVCLQYCSPKEKDGASTTILNSFPLDPPGELECEDPLPDFDFSVNASLLQGKNSAPNCLIPCSLVALPKCLQSQETPQSETSSVVYPDMNTSSDLTMKPEQLTPKSPEVTEDVAGTPARRFQLCLCGSERCRGYLF